MTTMNSIRLLTNILENVWITLLVEPESSEENFQDWSENSQMSRWHFCQKDTNLTGRNNGKPVLILLHDDPISEYTVDSMNKIFIGWWGYPLTIQNSL